MLKNTKKMWKIALIRTPFFTHLMKRASLGQLALKGGTTLNQLPRLTRKNTKFQWSIWSLLGNILNAFLVSIDSESMKI